MGRAANERAGSVERLFRRGAIPDRHKADNPHPGRVQDDRRPGRRPNHQRSGDSPDD
jgi:hypothetical protein